MTRLSLGILAAACGVAAPTLARAQAAAEPLRLAALQREAREADARRRELELLASQADLRVRNIDVERLPAVTASGQSQY